jgi:precorrin-6B C5,15-methyltransferase / cobalt-precorrin-6B C5,C15-methyltransferase
MSLKNDPEIHVVGTGLDPFSLPPGSARIVKEAEVLFGGRRILRAFEAHPARKIEIRAPVSKTVDAVQQESAAGRRVVILADGDPGFFGIGKRLVEELGPNRVCVHPNVTVLQAAASRLKTTWEDVRTVSLHGRTDLWPLRRAVAFEDRVGVYTDSVFDPARTARELVAMGVKGFRMHVFEDLELASERVRTFEDPASAAGEGFSSLAFVLLERTQPPPVPRAFGLDDACLEHDRGMITKREVRAVGLSLLGIRRRDTVWDLGAGSGAVSVEASILASEGRVYAVERSEERMARIRHNVEQTGAYVVEPVHGDMPACLKGLPDPDRIFVGGGVGEPGVLETAMARLRPTGRMVVHVVLLGSLEKARSVLEKAGWSYTVTQVQVHRSNSLARDLRLEALNPVYALCADKPEEETGKVAGKDAGNMERSSP